MATFKHPVGSAIRAAAVNPDDSAVIEVTYGVYVGTAGDLTVVMADDTDPVTFGVHDGAILPLRVKQVMFTGTDATGIVALY